MDLLAKETVAKEDTKNCVGKIQAHRLDLKEQSMKLSPAKKRCPLFFCITKISSYFLKGPHSILKTEKQRGPACFREFSVPSLRNDSEKPDKIWPCASAPPYLEPAIRACLAGKSSCSRHALPFSNTSKSISDFIAGLHASKQLQQEHQLFTL